MSYGPFTNKLDREVFIEPTRGLHDYEAMLDDNKQAIILDDWKDIMRGKRNA